MRCLTPRPVPKASLRTAVHHPRRPVSLRTAGICGRPFGRKGRVLRCAEISGSAVIKKLTAVELEAAIQDRSLPTIIDFYATWCGPCLMMAQELEKVAQMLKGRVRILKVDTDEEHDLSTALKIEGLPTLMFFSSDVNKTPLRLEGLIPAEAVIDIVNNKL